MNQEIEYRSGQFREFVATRSFDLGTTKIKALKGISIKFDGSRVEIEGHPVLLLPALRGAIRLGWLVPIEMYDANAAPQRPVSAGIQVRSAEGGNPMDAKSKKTIGTSQVESEEREVANVAAHAAATKSRNQTNYRTASSSEVLGDQGGVEVRKINSPAKWNTDLNRTSVSAAIRQAESIKVKPGQGRTREEMVAQMDPQEAAAYQAQIASKKIGHVPEEAPQIIATLEGGNKTQEREGVKVAGSVGRGVAIHDAGGTGGASVVTETVSEGIRMTNVNGPGTVKQAQAPAPTPVQNDAQARQIAKAICPDFPDNYRFDDPIRKKIARLMADYEDRPDVIRAVAAADVDPAVRARLLEEFPQAFSS